MDPTHAVAGKSGTTATQRPAQWAVAPYPLAACALGSVLALCWVPSAQSQEVMPDAQVQANVLKALAGAPELAGEDIHTRTVYGVVSLTGSVRSEALQVRAENLAANSLGVKKVVDELGVGSPVTTDSASGSSASGPMTSSGGADGQKVAIQRGTVTSTSGADPAPGSAPASTAVMNDPQRDQQQYQNQQADTRTQASDADDASGQNQQPGYSSTSTGPAEPQSGYPAQAGGYGVRPEHTGPGYEGAPKYGRYPDQRSQGRNTQNGHFGYPEDQSQLQARQQAGRRVIIPPDTSLRVRLDGTVSSDRSAPGSRFDGVVMSDVVADGAVAIPRGAQVQGTVVSATRAGVLKGRGDLSLELTSVTLGGQVYPLVTIAWAHHGGDKTIETVNKTAGFGAVGAVIGALAGGGEGAAVGGGIGAAAGLGSSATSGRGKVYLPAESVVTFRLREAAEVTTVSEQEMQRLAYGSAPNLRPRYPRRREYPQIYVGPTYYPGYYPGYYPRLYPGYYPPPFGYPPY